MFWKLLYMSTEEHAIIFQTAFFVLKTSENTPKDNPQDGGSTSVCIHSAIIHSYGD